jgi:hypothetical protein
MIVMIPAEPLRAHQGAQLNSSAKTMRDTEFDVSLLRRLYYETDKLDTISLYIKRLGMFPFKVAWAKQNLLTQNLPGNMLYDTTYCWRHITKPIPRTVAVVQHVCQVTLLTSYQLLLLSCNMFVRSHCRLHYTHINSLYTIPSIVGGILQCFELNTVCKGFKICN